MDLGKQQAYLDWVVDYNSALWLPPISYKSLHFKKFRDLGAINYLLSSRLDNFRRFFHRNDFRHLSLILYNFLIHWPAQSIWLIPHQTLLFRNMIQFCSIFHHALIHRKQKSSKSTFCKYFLGYPRKCKVQRRVQAATNLTQTNL